MAKRQSNPSRINLRGGDQAQMEQIRQSLARVAMDAAEKAAEKTVVRVFTALGADMTKPDGVIRLQKIIAFGGDMMEARDTIKKQSLRTAVILALTGAATLLVLGFKGWFRLPAVAVVACLIGMVPTPTDAHCAPVILIAAQ